MSMRRRSDAIAIVRCGGLAPAIAGMPIGWQNLDFAVTPACAHWDWRRGAIVHVAVGDCLFVERLELCLQIREVRAETHPRGARPPRVHRRRGCRTVVVALLRYSNELVRCRIAIDLHRIL